MTKTQLKSEIIKVLDNVPDSILQDVLDFLKELQNQPESKVKLTKKPQQYLKAFLLTIHLLMVIKELIE